ncbi:FCD domain-containing protein [Pseudarthrobacter sp902506025]|uniref:FCD domain-containing protein n=1 Tax=Pseudarthrobacter sp. 902506025 TaxID=3155291 RepID=UPI00344E9CDB
MTHCPSTRWARQPTASDIAALLTSRQILEPACTSIACTNSTEKLVGDLERFHRDLRRHATAAILSPVPGLLAGDENFHWRIVEATDNEFCSGPTAPSKAHPAVSFDGA